MQQSYTAIIQQQDGWWIGWIQEIPGVNCQERTRDELLDTLEITFRETIGYNREEAHRAEVLQPVLTENSIILSNESYDRFKSEGNPNRAVRPTGGKTRSLPYP